MKTFSCVIVNYRTSELVIKAVASVLKNSSAPVEIFVVDNASNDQSIQNLNAAIQKNGWQSVVTILESKRNGGFAYGCNLGALAVTRSSQSDFVLFLNPDAEILGDVFTQFQHVFDEKTTLGIVGATIISPDGSVQSAPHRFPSIWTELATGARLGLLDKFLLPPFPEDKASSLNYCDWVSGACFAARTTLLSALHGMDEQFFLYFEEVDLCRRAKRDSWKVAVSTKAMAVHREGASTGIKSVERRRPSYWFASRRRFFVLHYGRLGLLCADVFWSTGRLTWRFRRLLNLGAKRQENDPPKLMRDLLVGDFLFLIGASQRKSKT
jgi:N-acetylglucosaminyl-diphospho-decaprenol L-rhamnosyltransferase